MFDSMKGVSWGSVILGAAAVVAFVAFAPVITTGAAAAAAIAAGGAGTTVLGALTAEAVGLGSATVLASAATVGGLAGDMVSKLCHRGQDALTTLVQR